MDKIILKSDLERTCGEYVEKMFAGKFGACAMRQVKFLLGGVVEHGTTLVSALARGLRPDRRVSPKKQREMVSRHLEALDILPALQERLRRIAVQTAQLYLQRWQIETSFLRVKQDFGLEDARVRTFKRLENLFALCYLAYLFVQFHMPGCERYRKFVKVVKDNFETVSLRAEVMLANLRTLLREASFRFISGRPKKKASSDNFPRQLEFQFS